MMKIALVIATVLALGSTSPAPMSSPIEVQTGFEFLAVVDGKVFVRPIRSENSDNLNYQRAVETCASAGYRIATIESDAEMDAVGNFTCGPEYRWGWIDGIDIVTPDSYFSINSGKNLTYFRWSSWGQRPILGKDDRNCLRLSCNALEGPAMWDVECTDSYLGVICQV